MRIIVASSHAAEAIKTIVKCAEVVAAPVYDYVKEPVDRAAVAAAVESSDLVIFSSGAAAYRLREEGVSLSLSGKVVATAEGRRGAAMVKNTFGVEPQLVYNTAEDLAAALTKCGTAVLFHHGEPAEALATRLRELCRDVYEFYTYRAVPRDLSNYPRGDVYVFFNASSAEALAIYRPDLLKDALVVAAGPAIVKTLAKYNIAARQAPSGRIGDVAQYLKEIAGCQPPTG